MFRCCCLHDPLSTCTDLPGIGLDVHMWNGWMSACRWISTFVINMYVLGIERPTCDVDASFLLLELVIHSRYEKFVCRWIKLNHSLPTINRRLIGIYRNILRARANHLDGNNSNQIVRNYERFSQINSQQTESDQLGVLEKLYPFHSL